jgi:hypothetical protein
MPVRGRNDLVQLFNIGTPPRAQCAQRKVDGAWFIRYRRTSQPGFGRWERALFLVRPEHAWYSGQRGVLPAWKQSENVSGACGKSED